MREDGDAIAIGALTRHHDLGDDAAARGALPSCSRRRRLIGDPQVRHRGTIGGSAAHGDPASDLPTVLLALDAEFVVQGPGGAAHGRGGGLLPGIFETALGPQDVLTEIRVPARARGVLPEVQPPGAGLGDGRCGSRPRQRRMCASD